eukprot:scaffold1112_cov92-Amphora_coffeaeformis.AAC.28
MGYERISNPERVTSGDGRLSRMYSICDGRLQRDQRVSIFRTKPFRLTTVTKDILWTQKCVRSSKPAFSTVNFSRT